MRPILHKLKKHTDTTVSELEGVKHYLDAVNRGAITGEDDIETLRSFFARYKASPPTVRQDDEAARTELSAAGPIVAASLTLQHYAGN